MLQHCSSRRLNQISTGPVRIGGTQVMLDADLTFRTHVTSAVRACLTALRQIRSVKRSLPRSCLLTLIRSLIITKLDYCNSVLAGTPACLQERLQSVLNSAARLVFSARKYDHVTPLLHDLHCMAEGSRTHPVPTVRFGLPLFKWHRTFVPCQHHASDNRH